MRYLTTLTIAFVFATSAFAQLEARSHNLILPTTSSEAWITQEIGVSTVTFNWHRPGVKGREVWGTSLVPYDGKIWRAGANENTTITVSHDCTINGESLAAGTYGFHVMASEQEWTLIFSNVATAWGSYSYTPEEDALRVNATPVDAPHTEWLEFDFENLTEDGATAYLAWEEKKVPFDIAFDTQSIVISSIQDQLRGIPAFTWQGWYQAAQWAFENDADPELAGQWIEQSLQREENWMNLSLKGRMLHEAGDTDEAMETLRRALERAPEHRKQAVQDVIDELAP